MPARSHVDFCLFVQILEIDEDKIPPELKDILLSRNNRRIFEYLIDENHGRARQQFVDAATNLHESIHIIQAVIYPFLRWYSVLAFAQVNQVFKQAPDLLGASFVVPAFHILDFDWHIVDLHKKFLFWNYNRHSLALYPNSETPTKARVLATLNIVDLLENAASLMQFKIDSCHDFPSWAEYNRWTKRHKAYTNILDFAASYLDNKELALRAFLSLVQVSFETNRPVQAFAMLLAALKADLDGGHLKEIMDQPEPCRWIEIFDLYMNKFKFDSPDLGDLLSKKFFRLDRYNTSNIRLGGQLGHPIIGRYAKIWGDLEKDDISYRYAFTAPNGHRRQIERIGGIFVEPISILKFNVKDESVCLMTGDILKTGIAGWLEEANDKSLGDIETNVKGALIDFFAIFGFTRRLSNALMDDDFRLCYHQNCPLYKMNFCNLWIFIPQTFERCGFLSRFDYILNNHHNPPKAEQMELKND